MATGRVCTTDEHDNPARQIRAPDARRGRRSRVRGVRSTKLIDKLRSWISEVVSQRLLFTLVVLITLGLFGFLGVVVISGLLGLNAEAQAMGHFSSLSHRIHDFTFAFLLGTAAVGMLAQLRTPSKNVAGQLMALIPWVGLMLVIPLTNYWVAPGAGFVIVATALFGALTLNAMIFHPTGRSLFRSFSVSPVNRVMFALVIVAAVPLLVFALTNIGLQRTVTNDHFSAGHYGFMAAFSFTIIGVGLLASLRPDGWQLTAWVAGLLPALFGVTSLVYSDIDSSLGTVWALAAIAWGVVFVAVGERRTQGRGPTQLGARAVKSRSERG
ncbi:MAG: hypothetical protein H0U53_00565 [Actinobacteria bacterium]|nr:hypothetical protein [Actinomycetota bacterium]